MAEMEVDPDGPVLRTIGPKSDLALWLEMFPPSVLNDSHCYIIAEYDAMASVVDHFKVSLTTLRGVLSTSGQSRVILQSTYVVTHYPNRFATLQQRHTNQQKATLQLGHQPWLAHQNCANARTMQELTAAYQISASVLHETTQEMIKSFFIAWYKRNLQNLRTVQPKTPQLEEAK